MEKRISKGFCGALAGQKEGYFRTYDSMREACGILYVAVGIV